GSQYVWSTGPRKGSRSPPRSTSRSLSQCSRSVDMVMIGIGTDVHAFDPEAPCWVAGLHWPDEPGLAGHSDGDVVAHACADALLNAAGLGDLGGLIGTDRPEWRDAAGLTILRA